MPGKTYWEKEQADFNWYNNGLELRLFFRSPTTREVRAVERGPAAFALYVEGDVIFFLYQFAEGDIPWSDATYSWHLVPEENRQSVPAPSSDETRLLLPIILTDANTGIVRALRACTLSPDFSRALLGAIGAQAASPWCGRKDYDAQWARAYMKYPTSVAMLRVATHRTIGGT